MKKQLLALSVLMPLCGLSATAAREISGFREIKIAYGETAEINGVPQAEPDIYYVGQPDGTFEAIRLTVTPPVKRAEMTVPYLSNNTPESVCINWKSNQKTDDAVVRYGLSASSLDMTCSPSNRNSGRTYVWNTARLENLAPGTTYYYQVSANGKQSEIHTFRTMPQNGFNGKIRVLLIGDHQRNEHSDYEWLLSAARQTVAEKYGEGPIENHINFILNDGDQVDGGYIDLYEDVHLYKSRSVSPSLATMTAVGNHEYKNDAELKFYDLHFREYGALEYQGITSGTCGYYAYQTGNVLFVVIDSDAPTATQKLWVRKVIAAAANDDSVDFIVSVQHRPLFAEQYTYDVSPWMLNEIMPILSSTPKHVLNCAGHHHLYARGQMTDTPVYHIISGGGVGTSAEGYEQLWGTTPDNRNHEEVQKTIDHWTYQILEFDGATKEMTVETYSIGNSRIALDNELVDRFSRRMEPATLPERPSIAEVDAQATLPFTFTQTGSGKPHSAQYQISATPDFSTLLIDRLITAEDFYGADSRFMPLDINKDTDLMKFTVENGQLSNGTYFIRVRNRNSNLDWSDYSQPVEFTVGNSAPAATVSVGARFIRSSSEISLSYTGSPVGTDAWVGIYREGHRPGTADQSVAYVYTDAENGTWNFAAPQPGVYFAVLFKDGGYTEISPRVYFVVSDNCDDSAIPVIETDRFVYNVGEPVSVTYHNAPAISKDWIGLYSDGVTPVSGKSHSYRYVGTSPEGTLELNTRECLNYTSPVADGVYYIGYFNTDGYYESAERVYIVVGKPVIIDTDKQSYTPADNIRVVYDGAPPCEGNRMVITDGAEEVRQIPVTETGGYIDLGQLPAGSYEIHMATSGGEEISSRITVDVTGSDSLCKLFADTPTRIKVVGNMLYVSSSEPILTVDIMALDATPVASFRQAAACEFSHTVDAAPGVYFVTVNRNVTKKIVVR